MAVYLACCGIKNKAVTHELCTDGSFQERFIDYADCNKCGKSLLQRRFVDQKGRLEECLVDKRPKRQYEHYLKDKIQTFDNTFQVERGPFFPNVHYADDGIKFRMNGTSTGDCYRDGKWQVKIGGKYQ